MKNEILLEDTYEILEGDRIVKEIKTSEEIKAIEESKELEKQEEEIELKQIFFSFSQIVLIFFEILN